MQILHSQEKDLVIAGVAQKLAQQKDRILEANQLDLAHAAHIDQAMIDRLKVDEAKLQGMISAVHQIRKGSDPVGQTRYEINHPNGMKVTDRSAPFGTILIIYESRPDVTIEAAVVAFKSGNRILLKGGKEAIHTNRVLVDIWHQALQDQHIAIEWVQLLELTREETQAYLRNPPEKIDLIVPRGGEKLIAFARENGTCPVLVSGRGNNFIYIHEDASWDMAEQIIINAKTDKISACNALDKLLIHKSWMKNKDALSRLIEKLKAHNVEILVDDQLGEMFPELQKLESDSEWYKEYLAMKIAIGIVNNSDEAIRMINHYSGGHSAAIISADEGVATGFMSAVDVAAVYHNASTRFTDGGEFGVGAEMAISTDKLHHRGPLGVHHLVTNKWYIHGTGQIR